jgi:hypothetical protein
VINGQEVELALWLAVQELTAENKELRSKLADQLLPMIEKQQEVIRQLEERLARHGDSGRLRIPYHGSSRLGSWLGNRSHSLRLRSCVLLGYNLIAVGEAESD